MGDLHRVLNGARLVLNQSLRRSRPEVQWKLEKAVYHLSEFLKNMKEVVSESNQPRSHHQSSEYDEDLSQDNKRTKKAPEDIIGFSKVTDIDMKEYRENILNNNEGKLMRERAVPSSQIGRMFGFGSLAVRLAVGEITDRAAHAMSGDTAPRVISDQNAERLAEALCRMRGAALKIGQMLSLQDESSLPPSMAKALERVKQAADYMPKRQLEQQLINELGANWAENFKEFDMKPIAAASIGQVHKATLHDGSVVAMKIQYPGVADSIESDLDNLKQLISVANILPRGLFIDNIIAVARKELKAECDYATEATNQMRYKQLVEQDEILSKYCKVPAVIPNLSTGSILATEFVPGIPIDRAIQFSQPMRNAIARTVLVMTIKELFEWRFIQSDPNFANFLFDGQNKTLYLIDFGAAREYSKDFVDKYMTLVWAAANKDRQSIIDVSKELGFLNGDENEAFLNAHVDAGLIVGEPFLDQNDPQNPENLFDFGNSQLTQRIGSYGSTFMRYRLTPPPTEAYSLHRKLAGAFLLCIKLKAKIPCRDILEQTHKYYTF